jgi:ribosomal protein S18 acetylase RimI-like enzyme
MNMIEIRPYAAPDYEVIKTNLERSGMFDPVCDAKDNLAAMVGANPRAILVAEADGALVGSIYTAPIGKHVVSIWRLVVSEQQRKRGVGSALLQAVEADAKQNGAAEIWGFFDVTKTHLANYYRDRGFTFNPDHHYFAMWKPLET